MKQARAGLRVEDHGPVSNSGAEQKNLDASPDLGPSPVYQLTTGDPSSDLSINNLYTWR